MEVTYVFPIKLCKIHASRLIREMQIFEFSQVWEKSKIFWKKVRLKSETWFMVIFFSRNRKQNLKNMLSTRKHGACSYWMPRCSIAFICFKMIIAEWKTNITLLLGSCFFYDRHRPITDVSIRGTRRILLHKFAHALRFPYFINYSMTVSYKPLFTWKLLKTFF